MLGKTNALNGGGLEDLNFSIVGGENPPVGVEGLIWVETSEEINGWVFSST